MYMQIYNDKRCTEILQYCEVYAGLRATIATTIASTHQRLAGVEDIVHQHIAAVEADRVRQDFLDTVLNRSSMMSASCLCACVCNVRSSLMNSVLFRNGQSLLGTGFLKCTHRTMGSEKCICTLLKLPHL